MAAVEGERVVKKSLTVLMFVRETGETERAR